MTFVLGCKLVFMDKKVRVNNFDESNCEGCPHRVEGGENTGNGAVDRLASAQTRALSAAKGRTEYKCGLCGCPLFNLALFGSVPVNCPRIEDHGGEL